ncbi:hypothetical protein AVEN_121260-1 [Araneus ventricosus]|uniref:Uncharacterized protein n=1 Tax=Araneus ventricosus TaxID=182803 RepID=A0A4Y2R7P3_ARAVE|nr:hypothetical protein AVEN_121260-1 [Araneus ventricosus]
MLVTVSAFDSSLADRIERLENTGSGQTSYLSSSACEEFHRKLKAQSTILYLRTQLRTKPKWEALKKSSTLSPESLCTAQWSARCVYCRALKQHWFGLIDSLKYLESDETENSGVRAEARGILMKQRGLATAFMAQFWGTLLLRSHRVNKHVQNVDIHVLEALHSLVEFLKELLRLFYLYEEKALNISGKKVHKRDEKCLIIRKLRSDETRDGKAFEYQETSI